MSTAQRARIIAVRTEAQHLKPGDIYSPLGPEYWNKAMTRDIAAPVYMRSNVPLQDGLDETVFRLSIELINTDGSSQMYRFEPHTPPGT